MTRPHLPDELKNRVCLAATLGPLPAQADALLRQASTA